MIIKLLRTDPNTNLSSYACMISTRNPNCRSSLHAVISDHNILQWTMKASYVKKSQEADQLKHKAGIRYCYIKLKHSTKQKRNLHVMTSRKDEDIPKFMMLPWSCNKDQGRHSSAQLPWIHRFITPCTKFQHELLFTFFTSTPKKTEADDSHPPPPQKKMIM